MIVNANSIVQYVFQIKNGTMKHVNMSVKIIVRAKKGYNWNSSTFISENGKYLKSITDHLKIFCNEIINVAYSASTNWATNYHKKSKM